MVLSMLQDVGRAAYCLCTVLTHYFSSLLDMLHCCLYHQTPNMAICDANLVDGMPKSLTAFGGLDALVHALESYVSVCATDYTKGECF